MSANFKESISFFIASRTTSLSADKEVVLEAIKNDIDSLKFADKKIIKWFESLSLWSRDQLLGLNKDKDPFGD